MDELQKFYQDKKVFITGHTGFKGSWLTLFLKHWGADVTAYALPPNSNRNSLFNLANIQKKCHSCLGDINDYENLLKSLQEAKPHIVFHLAAQALVRESYMDPKNTYLTNVMGTVHLLEATRQVSSIKAIVNVTTDKCYENKEWYWSYRENDTLGGHDPYSSSKACSELVTTSYRKSFLKDLEIGLASVRAGNVIGGGDFAKDRIIPDIVSALEKEERIVLRNSKAIRPWQHVFDVLYAYLLLGKKLYEEPKHFSEAFNISPIENKEVTVQELTKEFLTKIGYTNFKIDIEDAKLHEAQSLKLDSSKALSKLTWQPKYDIFETLEKTVSWYKGYLENTNIEILCKQHLQNFLH